MKHCLELYRLAKFNELYLQYPKRKLNWLYHQAGFRTHRQYAYIIKTFYGISPREYREELSNFVDEMA